MNEKMLARLEEIGEELDGFDPESMSADDEARFDALTEEAAEIRDRVEKAERRGKAREELREAVESGKAAVEGPESGIASRQVHVNAGRSKADPYDLSDVRTVGRSGDEVVSEMRSRAASAIEAHRDLDDGQKEAATRRLERVSDKRGFIPEYVLRTGSDAYGSAFHKYMAGRSDLWNDAERHAVSGAEEVRASLTTTDANGGYAIPFTLDPNLILTNDGVVNPVRRVARQETIVTDSWNGLTSAGATFSWDGEVSEVSDDSPTFSQPSVTPQKAQGFIQGSIEISQDYPNLVADLQEIFADGKDRLEGAAFITGDKSSDQPEGIITALDGGSSEVDPDTSETFSIEDIYAVLEALPPRFRSGRARVAWLAELSTINAMRQFATANNYHAFLTDLAAGQPRQLLGYPLYESSEMGAAADIDDSKDEDNHILLVGDWTKYLIVDRVGMVVEYIPHLFNTANNLPDGRRGWYAHWRVGADSLVDDAFRVLNVATTA